MLRRLSWKEIYVTNVQQVFSETRLEDVDLSKTQPCKYFVYVDRGNPSQDWRVNYANSIEYAVTLFDCNHLAHVIVLWQMQNILCYCTLSYFEFESNFQLQASGAYIWTGDLSEVFLRYEFWGGGGYIWKGFIHGRAYFRNFTAVLFQQASRTLNFL